MDWREARGGASVGEGWVPLVDKLHAEILKPELDPWLPPMEGILRGNPPLRSQDG